MVIVQFFTEEVTCEISQRSLTSSKKYKGLLRETKDISWADMTPKKEKLIKIIHKKEEHSMIRV